MRVVREVVTYWLYKYHYSTFNDLWSKL